MHGACRNYEWAFTSFCGVLAQGVRWLVSCVVWCGCATKIKSRVCWGSVLANKMQGALDLDLGSVAGKGYIRVGVLGGGKRVVCEVGGTGLNQSCWGSVSANEMWGVFNSSWSTLGLGG